MKIRPLITALSLASLGIFGVSCKSNDTAKNGGYDDGAYVGNGSGEYDNVYETGGGDDYDAYSYESDGGSSYNYESNDYSSSPAPTKPTYTPAPSKPTSTPTYTPAPSRPTYTPAPTSSARSHTVQRGDTLFNLSRRYGTTVSAIQNANGLSGDLIRIGETLTIP